jgi:hypothetical protein
MKDGSDELASLGYMSSDNPMVFNAVLRRSTRMASSSWAPRCLAGGRSLLEVAIVDFLLEMQLLSLFRRCSGHEAVKYEQIPLA